MAGLQIPIGGDLAPFLAVAAELRKEMGTLAKSVRGAVGPAKSETEKAAASFRTLWQSTKSASAGVRALSLAVGSTAISLRFLQGVAGKAFGVIAREARGAMRVVSGIGAAIKGMIPGGAMLGPLAGIAGLAGSIALLVTQVKAGAGLAGDIERTGIALEALTGSGDTAKKVLDDMRATWLRTGVAIEQQAPTIQKFLALGFSPGDAVKLQKNILDVAGAVGMTADEANLLGSALAQVKAKGTVAMEELRQQIAEKGVPVFEALADKMGVTQAALIKMVSDGKVPADDLLSIFLNMEGAFGKFVGGANRMGMSFLGLINRLKGSWNLLLAEFAAPIVDSLKPLMLDALGVIESFKASAREAGKVVGDALLGAFALVKTGNTQALFAAGMKMAMAAAVDVLMRGLESAVAFLVNTLPPVFDAVISKLTDPNLWQGLGLMISSFGKSVGAEIRGALPGANPDVLRGLRMQSEIDAYNARAAMSRVTGPDLSDALIKGLSAGIPAAASEFTRPISEGLKQTSDEFKTLLETVRAEMDSMRAGAAIPAAAGANNPYSPSSVINAPAAVAAAMESARKQIIDVTSLGRVGGGGFAGAPVMISEQRRGNTLLRQIVDNTRRLTGAAPAIV